jgi:hypothetical protein
MIKSRPLQDSAHKLTLDKFGASLIVEPLIRDQASVHGFSK